MLRPWLFRVAHNLVIDETRRAAHRQHAVLDDTISAGAENIEEQAQRAVMAEHASDALNSLTPKQRSIIFLKFFEGMDNAEVAGVMGLPVGAVKSLQYRALGALRRHLTGVASRM
jgi:RNA polymerase sigma-70 factor (ECF subfamily)